MSHKSHPGLVRILDGQGNIVGAGFLVEGERVITCLHVIVEALQEVQSEASQFLGREVTIDFPALSDRPRVSAQIIFSGGAAGTSKDLAVLKVIGALPQEAMPLVLVNKQVTAGEDFSALGFPVGHDDGLWVKGVCGNEHTAGLIQLSVIGVPVKPGASGSPLWSEQHEGIIGILVSRINETDSAAFAIPIASIANACPDIILRPPKASTTWSNDLSLDLKQRRLQIHISETANGMFEWKGDIPPAEVAKLWARQSNIDVAYSPRLNRASDLSDVLLRICLHGAGGSLYVNDPIAWLNRTSKLIDDCLGIPWDKHSPSAAGPNADSWGILDYSTFQLNAGSFSHSLVISGAELSSLLHEQLDHWVLEEIADKVQGLLDHNPAPELALHLEVNLALQMSHVWQEWSTLLRDSPNIRRHFLKVTLSTAIHSKSKAGQARVGKRTIQKCLVEAVVLALAVTVGLPKSWRPTISDGSQNLSFDPDGTGHLCGLELIDSVRLVQKIGHLNWQADYVFLPHYPGPGDEIPDLMRHLTDDESKVRRFDNVDGYSPLFFTNEAKLTQLLAVGLGELQVYLLGVVAKWDERQQAEIDRAAGGGNAVPES